MLSEPEVRNRQGLSPETYRLIDENITRAYNSLQPTDGAA